MKIGRRQIEKYEEARKAGKGKHTAVRIAHGGRYADFQKALKTYLKGKPDVIGKKRVVNRILPTWKKPEFEKEIQIIKKLKFTKVRVRVAAKRRVVLPFSNGRYCVFPYEIKRNKAFKKWQIEKKEIRELIREGVPETQMFVKLKHLQKYEDNLTIFALRCFYERNKYEEFAEESRYYH